MEVTVSQDFTIYTYFPITTYRPRSLKAALIKTPQTPVRRVTKITR
jgi:hypothetical protein